MKPRLEHAGYKCNRLGPRRGRAGEGAPTRATSSVPWSPNCFASGADVA